jgi:hypothetical protein
MKRTENLTFQDDLILNGNCEVKCRDIIAPRTLVKEPGNVCKILVDFYLDTSFRSNDAEVADPERR